VSIKNESSYLTPSVPFRVNPFKVNPSPLEERGKKKERGAVAPLKNSLS
jgi:hypothetical protein